MKNESIQVIPSAIISRIGAGAPIDVFDTISNDKLTGFLKVSFCLSGLAHVSIDFVKTTGRAIQYPASLLYLEQSEVERIRENRDKPNCFQVQLSMGELQKE